MPIERWMRHASTGIPTSRERSTPGVDVVVVRVDEGAVDVEQNGRGGLASAGFHER